MKSKLTVKGAGLLDLRKFAKAMALAPHFKVGVLGDKAEREPGLTNAELAAIHEFGAPRAGVPERSFLRSTANAQRMAWLLLLTKLLKANMKGSLTNGVYDSLALVGERAVADIRKTIRGRIAPALKPETIARKGSSVPLIDSGRLLQSIGYEVVRDGTKK